MRISDWSSDVCSSDRGVGTIVAEGKEEKLFEGDRYILETGLKADRAIVKARIGDERGNLVYRKTARNFNPMVATCSPMTVAEVEIGSASCRERVRQYV